MSSRRLTNGIHLGGYSYIDVRGAPTRDSSDRDTIALNEISEPTVGKWWTEIKQVPKEATGTTDIEFVQHAQAEQLITTNVASESDITISASVETTLLRGDYSTREELRSTFEVSEKESDCDTDRTEIMGSVDVALLTEAPSQPIIPRLNNEIDIVDENVENAHRSEMVKAKSAVEEVPSVFREMCHDVPSETICAVTGDGSQTDTSYRSFIMKRHSVEASENCPASPEYTHRAQQHQTERHENLIANPLRKSNKVHAVFIPAASNSVSEFERIYEGDESTIYNTISCRDTMTGVTSIDLSSSQFDVRRRSKEWKGSPWRLPSNNSSTSYHTIREGSEMKTDVSVINERLLQELKESRRLQHAKEIEMEKMAVEVRSSLKRMKSEQERYKAELDLVEQRRELSEIEFQKTIHELKSDVAKVLEERNNLSSQLRSAEEQRAHFEANMAKLSQAAAKSESELAVILSAKVAMVEEWKEREQEYMQKIAELQKGGHLAPSLEKTVEALRSEAQSLREDLECANSRLAKEIHSKRKIASALVAVEQRYLMLDDAKKTVEMECKNSRERMKSDFSAGRTAVEIAAVESSCVEEPSEMYAVTRFKRTKSPLKKSCAPRPPEVLPRKQTVNVFKEVDDSEEQLKEKLFELEKMAASRIELSTASRRPFRSVAGRNH
ncbi:hypothetical protein Q1695_006068 [Nippostrongylus brasiliensis]|nr:hypothetical protein Q1695_006068 [Nippostrongylus brasiliensis]